MDVAELRNHAHRGSVTDELMNAAADEIERLRGALHSISLGSQNSAHSKEALGKEARAALNKTSK